MAVKIHQPLLKFTLIVESDFTEGETDDSGNPQTTVTVQCICRGARTKGKWIEMPVRAGEFKDRAGLFAWINKFNDQLVKALPPLVVEAALEAAHESAYLGVERKGREVDKKDFRGEYLKREARRFNERWRMPKGPHPEISRDELQELVREAVRRLEANEKPTFEKVAGKLGWTVNNFHKHRRRHGFSTWRSLLYSSCWYDARVIEYLRIPSFKEIRKWTDKEIRKRTELLDFDVTPE